MSYIASDAEKPIDVLNLSDLEIQSGISMEKGAFGYLRGGAEDELTLKENIRCFNDKKIIPRVLQNISHPSLETQILGIKISTPVIQAPVAAQGLAHVRGEMASVQGVAAAGTISSISTYSSLTIAATAAGSPGAPLFFQLYMSKTISLMNTSSLRRSKPELRPLF